ncbi:MAG: WecB/TagA/CpsF family glycosyltransferase [Lachnospiraceae bacterium]|nr:WecB/TagA/CpsF family glycosyltransferase [Lachnospiraceae bacterium]
MSKKIEVLGIQIDCMNADQEMERVVSLLENDQPDTIGMVTMTTLLMAEQYPDWKKYLEGMAMLIIGEPEVLTAAGVEDGQIMEEVKNNEFIAHFFWYLVRQDKGIFLLGETQEEISDLRGYLIETYPGLKVIGAAVAAEDTPSEAVMNEINSSSADVIISGLQGLRQERLVMENRHLIDCRIWFCLGEHPEIQSEAGVKSSWLGTLLRKSTFKRLAARYHNEK